MLTVSPLSYKTTKNDRDNHMESFTIRGVDDFPGFGDGNLLESIDFDDIFLGINVDDDVLPDLEMDSEILAEFSVSSGDESDRMNSYNTTTPPLHVEEHNLSRNEVEKVPSDLIQKSEKSKPKSKENDKCKKSSGQSKNPEGKRKVKVDWTPELHRRFVQAVEQLGVDKAVPSRILELMGVEGLTRHNIASHLQKYRAHRKHLLAREAEAASWSQRKQMYVGAAVVGGGGKRDINPWPSAPTMGFPPMPTPPIVPPHFRPLHVWGHPPADQSMMHMWPKHMTPLPPAWAPVVPPHSSLPTGPSFWHSHHQRVLNSLAPGTPCFPSPIASTRFPVQSIPPPAMIKAIPTEARQDLPEPPSDFHPSKESIDAAIGDVLAKPCLPPPPLGLKPPSIDSVLNELQRQGMNKIPPT